MVNLQTMKIFRCFVLLCMIGLCAVVSKSLMAATGMVFKNIHSKSTLFVEADSQIATFRKTQ